VVAAAAAVAAGCSSAPRTTSATSSGTGCNRPRSVPRRSASPARPRTRSSSSASGAWRRSWGPRAADARYGGDLDARSHGESFLAFLRARLGGRGLYLLDEPEAALSPLRQLALVALLREATERGAQFVIATHAPILMAFPGGHDPAADARRPAPRPLRRRGGRPHATRVPHGPRGFRPAAVAPRDRDTRTRGATAGLKNAGLRPASPSAAPARPRPRAPRRARSRASRSPAPTARCRRGTPRPRRARSAGRGATRRTRRLPP